MTIPLSAPQIPTWLDRFTAAIDTMDVELQLGFFTEDASFTFGNNPPMIGHDGIRDGINAFFRNLHGIRHTVPRSWQPSSDVVVAEYTTTYVRLDDTEVTLNASGVFQLRGERIAEYHVYTDLSPLFAA
jgi:ketosteroid isomerase-like protein